MAKILTSALVIMVAAMGFTVADRFETAFKIPLPAGPSNTEFFYTGVGDTYFTVGQGGRLFAVNLNEKKLAWEKEFSGDAISGMEGFNGTTAEVLLLSLGEVTMAMDNTSKFLWASASVTLPDAETIPNQYGVVGNTLFVISQEGYLVSIDLLTGASNTSTTVCSPGQIFATEAVCTSDGSQVGVNNQITAYSLPSMTQKWTLSAGAFLAQNSEYLVVSFHPEAPASFSESDSTAGQTEILVLNPNTLAKIATIYGASGIDSNNFYEIVNHHFFLAKIGDGSFAYFDLRSGRKLWELTPGGGSTSSSSGGSPSGAEGVTNAIASDYSIVLLDGLTLHFINISTGQRMNTQWDVPVTSEGTITTTLGGRVTDVWNLQGYTSWNSRTGAYVGRNEMDPSPATGPTGNAPYLWKGKYYVSTVGAFVIGQVISP